MSYVVKFVAILHALVSIKIVLIMKARSTIGTFPSWKSCLERQV